MASNIMFPKVSISIHSATNGFSIVYDNTASVNDALMTNGFIGGSTSNDLSQDSAAFSLMLAGDFRWDYVLNENDVIVIKADPQEGTGEAPVGGTVNTNIFVGMVSEVHIVGDFSNPALYYQVSGKSMSKIFSSYKVGLVEEAQNELTNMGWLWDINADYESSSSSGDSDSNSSSDGGGGSGSISKSDFEKIAKSAAKIAGEKLSSADIDQLYSQAMNESGVKEDPAGGYDDHDGTGIPRGMFQYKTSTWSSWHWPGYDNILSAKDQFLAVFNDSTWRSDFPPTGVKRGWTPHGSKVSGGAKSDKSSSSDSDSDSSSGDSGLSADDISKEQENSTGVAFMGNSVSVIEEEIIERFKDYIRISYNNGANTVFDYLDYTGMTSWDDDESLTDSTQYTSFDGSLLELMDAIRVQPFNEFYFETTADSKGKMVVRRTPFETDDWAALPTLLVDSSALISTDISKSDTEAYSIFNVNPDTYGLFSISANSGLLGSYPQYNQTLVDTYGYSKLEVTNQYLSGAPEGNASDDDTVDEAYSKKDTDSATAGKAYNQGSVNSYLSSIGHQELRKNPATYAQKLTNKADNISPDEATALVQSYINNSYVISVTHWNSIMHTSTGGGQSNTGSQAVTLKNVKKYLKKSSTLADFTALGKANLKNVDDEELAAIYNKYVDNKKKLSQKELNKAIKANKSTNASTVSGDATTLKRFTQRLYNWYCENPNFYAGDVVVVGHPEYRVGDRLLLYMNNHDDTFEFYIESVKHNISFTDGWTTTLGVTRGLPQSGQYRFNNLWGQSEDFLGGLMGEASFANMAFESDTSDSDSDSSSGSSKTGSKAMKAAVKKAENWISEHGQGSITYVWGAGRGSTDPWSGNGNPGDCSSTMAWLYKDVGCELVPTGSATTYTLYDSDKVTKVDGGSASKVWSNLEEGDLVFWDTDGKLGHVGLYVGNNNCIANNTSTGISKFDASNSYWQGYWSGEAVRPK